jgi:hypothetical protein
MKNLVLTLMAAFASVFAMANTYPTLSVEGKKSFILELNDWKNEELVITITDKKGEVLHAEKYNNASASRKYNLKKLPIGFYKMTIADQLKDITLDISITTAGVNVKNTNKVYFRPFVKYTEPNLDINILTLKKDVKLILYNSNNEIVYKESTENLKKFEKRLDISKLPAGFYTLNIYVGNRMYSENIVR